MNRGVAPLVVAIVVSLWAAEATAQGTTAQPGRFEFSAGPVWMTGSSYGSRDATLTTASGGATRLFSTSSELGSATGLELRFGSRVLKLIQAEVAGSYATPQLRTTISADLEAAGSTLASETVEQFVIEGAAIINLVSWRPRPAVLPFVTVGAGYLRQLHDARTLVETGHTYHLGGGMKLSLRPRTEDRLKDIGLRLEGRAFVRKGGVSLDEGAHASAAITAALFVRF